ncbi:hypothetical protein B0A55_10782, partial [Friedmanniomyces simplex]
NHKLARVRVRDLQPVRAPTPALTLKPAPSRTAVSGGHDLSLDFAAKSTTGVVKMPKLQARNDVRPDPSNVYALKEMLQSLEEEVDKDEARYRMLKSTMEWDSDDDDEAEKPGLRRLIGSLKRRSNGSDENAVTNSRSLLGPKDSVTGRHRKDAAVCDGTLSPPALDREEVLTSNAFSEHLSTEEFASRFTRKMEGKSLLQAATSGNFRNTTLTSMDEKRQPGSSVLSPAVQLRPTLHIAATDVATNSDNTPFSNSLVPYKPLPRTPESSTTTSVQVLPQSFDSDLRTYDMAQESMQQYLPPPDPDTPTRSAGRSLRRSKSDYSIRTSVIGARLAPQIAPPKRTAKVEIINRDDSPGVYIARAATAAGLLSSPLHPDWEAAIETVKKGLAKELKEAGRKAREDEQSRKPTSKDTRSAEQQFWKQHGDRIMSPASSFDSAPSVDYAAMTDEDLQAFAWALQREIEQGASTNVVRRLFRHIGEQKAKEKENVIRQAVLAKQKWLVDREMEARAEGRRSAEEQHTATHTGTPKPQLVTSFCNKKLDGQISHTEKERATTGLALIESPDPEGGSGGRHAVLHSADGDDDEILSGETEPEREHSRLDENLRVTPPVDRTAYPVGLGITGVAGGVMTSAMDTTAGLRIRSTPGYPLSTEAVEPSYPNTPSHPRSPFGEESLKVDRSSTAPINRFGKPVFQPKRNDSFMRKIEEAASRAKELRSIGSHPALRESPRKADLPPAPATAPLLTLNDIWDFDEEETQRYADLVRGEARKRDGRKDSGGWVERQNWKATNSEATVDVPVLTVESDSGSRTSIFDWDALDEGHATGPIQQHSFTVDGDEAEQGISHLELHDQLRRLSEFVNLQYPNGQDDTAEEEEPEYVDNPEYDPATEALIPYAQNDAEETPALPAPGTVIKVNIDDIIAQWESSSAPSSSSNSPTSVKTCCVQAESLLPTTPYRHISDDQRKAPLQPLMNKLDLRYFPPLGGIEQYGGDVWELLAEGGGEVQYP